MQTQVQQQVTDAVERGAFDEAWGYLASIDDVLADIDATRTWLAVARWTPTRPGIIDTARAALAKWPHDEKTVIVACAALLAVAERRSFDDPSHAQKGSPALLVRDAAKHCLEAHARGTLRNESASYLFIHLANGARLARDFDSAERAFERAVELDPKNGQFWLDACQLYKVRGDFAKGLRTAKKALELLEASGEPHLTRAATWNVAICATALADGAEASATFAKLGIHANVTASGMPMVESIPPAFIRVPTRLEKDGSSYDEGAARFEVVPVRPISPCHGIVLAPVFHTALCDYGDVVLWDARPSGMKDGTPVFALLGRLAPGTETMWTVQGREQTAGEIRLLDEILRPLDAHLFVQEERIEVMCSRCASGDVLTKHAHEAPTEHRVVRGRLVSNSASNDANVHEAVKAFVAGRPSVSLSLQIVMRR